MSILISIIGGSGFVGIALSNSLAQRQVDFRIGDLNKSASFSHKSNILDVRSSVDLATKLTGDFVVNLAAVHRDDVTDPEEYYSTNVDGTRILCDACEKKGIEVLYVTENPELKYQARSCMPRPLNSKVSKRCNQNMEVVLARQKSYRENLMELENVTVVDSNLAFCERQTGTCFAVNEKNELLYADDDHLSVIGSVWQYEKLIKAYFERN